MTLGQISGKLCLPGTAITTARLQFGSRAHMGVIAMPNPIRWVLEIGLNLPLFSPVIVVAIVLTLSLGTPSPPTSTGDTGRAGGQQTEETRRAPTHAEAAAAAEKAAGMTAGMFGQLGDVHNFFLVCTNDLSILTPPARQERCYDYGVALLAYFDVMRPHWDADDLAGWERLVIERMEALAWKDGSDVKFRPARSRGRRKVTDPDGTVVDPGDGSGSPPKKKWAKGCLWAAGIFVALAIIGSFLPDPPPPTPEEAHEQRKDVHLAAVKKCISQWDGAVYQFNTAIKGSVA